MTQKVETSVRILSPIWIIQILFLINLIFSNFNTANPRVAYDFRVDGKAPDFVPDGMTIDAEGNLYVATWGGSKVVKIDPR